MPQDGNSAGSMWNCEMSMLDVDGRGWMLGPMYDMHTGQLLVSMGWTIDIAFVCGKCTSILIANRTHHRHYIVSVYVCVLRAYKAIRR